MHASQSARTLARSEARGLRLIRRRRLDGRHAGERRALVQPGLELLERCRRAEREDFDRTIRQIDCMPGNTERFSDAARAVAEVHALYASPDRK